MFNLTRPSYKQTLIIVKFLLDFTRGRCYTDFNPNNRGIFNMKKYIKIMCIGALLAVFSVGCAVTQHLPSVTVGGKANKHDLVGLSVKKSGLTAVAPLVAVEVPFPNASLEDK
jgi:hypothetical protein